MLRKPTGCSPAITGLAGSCRAGDAVPRSDGVEGGLTNAEGITSVSANQQSMTGLI
jgi:hypothetical protein